MTRQIWGSCKYLISLSWFMPPTHTGGVSLQNCLSIIASEFEIVLLGDLLGTVALRNPTETLHLWMNILHQLVCYL